MTKNYKDMTQKELRDLLSEKNRELFELAKKINEEVEFDVLLFSSVGVSNGDYTSIASTALGNVVGLANLLDGDEDYQDIANAISLFRLQEMLGIDDDEEEPTHE